MPRTCGGRRWLGGRGGCGNWPVHDLSGGSANVGGWGWVAGDDSSGHVLDVQALEKMMEKSGAGAEEKAGGGGVYICNEAR